MTFEDDGQDPPPDDPDSQDPPDDTNEPDPDPIEQPVDTTDITGTGAEGAPKKADADLGDSRVSWQDIVVVVRKPFLKVRRVELAPSVGITMNDNIIRHLQFNASLNWFISDVLAVGLEGSYYVKDLREPFDLVARQARRLPTVNKYNFGAALNFHYVPVYGKFAVFNSKIIHWETQFTAGVGFTQSEVIPRDPRFQEFKNFLITPNVGATFRFFISKWVTVSAGFRDYVFVDQFEAQDRMEVNGDLAKDNADSALINNIVFQLGVSLWIPPTFEYTTFR